MKLEKKTSVFNMGDTSIRVKQSVEVNKIILKELYCFMKNISAWNLSKNEQENFYKIFIKEIVRLESNVGMDLFYDFTRLKNYEPPSSNKIGLRGRTLTNALVKTGLINSDRIISEVGLNYLKDNLKTNDPFEKLLSLSPDNLIYFRQYLKLRIYSSDSDSFFYNFRFALKFLSKYQNVPRDNFLNIVESIRPEQTEEFLNKLIEDYAKVDDGTLNFNDFYTKNFTNFLSPEEERQEVKKMFQERDFTDEKFIRFFPNAKSSEISLLYKNFVLAILNFKNEPTNEHLIALIEISKDSKIKKAFSNGKLPFVTFAAITPETFIENNKSNPLLSDDYFNIYLEFVFSKHNDLIREYSDMCRRAFQSTGIISFENGLTNLNNSWIIKPFLEIINDRFTLTGDESYNNYENTLDSIWFSDLTTMEILNVTNVEYELLITTLAERFGEKEIAIIPDLITRKREKEYRDFINENFPKERIIAILENISIRNDKFVFKNVTDNATVPTIFEYILTIAWFYLSENKDYFLHKSFGVSLDGNKLPLIHQGGGKGDVEIITGAYALLIEATLMDSSTQRRAELEPVIRHSINFTIENEEKSSQTIFIANDLDENVLNIFRASQFIQFNGTIQSSYLVDGLNIFAFTTKELVQLLKNNVTDNQIIETINNNLDKQPTFIKSDWRESTINQLGQ